MDTVTLDSETNEPCLDGTIGEFCCKGYYKIPEENAKVIDSNGYLHSGDLGYRDSDGYFYVTGRIKDMIIRGGENIYPKEVEDYLYHCPGVRDVQVVGDAPLLRTLVSTAAEKGHMFDTVYADGAYASDDNWIFLCRENRYGFITSFKVNTAPTINNCFARGKVARLWCSLPYDEWVKISGYGTRWKCECVFSDFKRIFPETVTARTIKGIVLQVTSRVNLFNEYKELRANITGITGNGVVLN